MATRRWKYINGKLTEVFPNKNKSYGFKGPYIGKNPWARTTKVEFSETSMDESIKKMNNG